MIEAVRALRPRTLEFGIYRDGDNNLDDTQESTITQAIATSKTDRSIEFTVEDTHSPFNDDGTVRSTISDGTVKYDPYADDVDNMASPKNLANFVARTLDNAERSGAKQTWIELVDHGAGDGGGLEADSFRQIMPMPQIAQAIADGIKMHAQEHPEDAGRTVDGVVANQCLMSSLGFADALSHAGVKYLAASPETMISPGVPTKVAQAIAAHTGDATAMAHGVVSDVMDSKYGTPSGSFGPAAAFDVLDTSRAAIAPVETSVKALNDAIAKAGNDAASVNALREDGENVEGMVRFPEATPDMPWHADRPAIALYGTIANDTRLDASIRNAAADAQKAVANIVIAHKESDSFAPFGGSSFADAVGPTVHFPVNAKQIDPWAPHVSETKNRFFNETDAAAAERVVA